MGIIGWVRQGDKAGCGGTVVEGDATCISHGRPLAFQGAKMACQKSCVIVEGFLRSTLTNGRPQVLHGMKTSNGCPLQSTLNGIDGTGSVDGPVHQAVVPVGGDWKGIDPPAAKHDEAFDEYFIVVDEQSGAPATNRFYRMTLDNGEVIEGYTDDEGRTSYATSDQRIAVDLELAPQREIEVGE